MSMRRVSSRPRLVSDADRASQISSFMEEENYDTSTLLSLDTIDIENCCKGDYSYFLFGHDDTDDVNGGTIQEVKDEDDNERKKSAAATATTAVVIANDNNGDKAATTTMTGGDSDHYPKRNTSNDTLSDYASCCTDEDEETTTTTTSNNVTNLEMSFQKSSLSSNEDEGGMEVAAASYLDRQLLATSTCTSTTITACTKRKRLSQQHYLTPNSSYAELQQQNSSHMMWYSPSSPVRGGGYSASYNIGVGQPSITSRMQHHPHYCFTNNTTNHHEQQQQQQHSPTQTNTPNKPTTPIQTLPEETLIQICTHLTHNDTRSIGSTCHYIRMVVTRSTCAIENLWMGWLIGRFPVVFGATNAAADNDNDDDNDGRVVEKRRSSSRRRMHSSHVTFVDDFELPMAASPSASATTTTTTTGFAGVDHDIRNNNSVNLPLLTGLLAPRYPQLMNLRQGGEELPFRCFTRSIPRATTATTTTTTATVGVNNSPMMDDEEGNDIDDDDVVALSVIQFTGRVGTGDRSIRSDFPFPPNCRTIGCSSSGSSSGSSHSGCASLKSLSTWMKNHTPLRSRGNKRKNGRAPVHSMVRDLSPPPTQARLYNRQFLTLSNANYPLHAGRSLHLPLNSHSANNNERSPLFRFLSSLSHHCDCVSSSNTSSFVDNNEAEDDDVNDINSTVSLEQNHSDDHDDDDDDEIGVNDYGMMIRHNGNGLLEQCKQKLGYNNNKSIKDNLRPFVIPTVVSSSSSSGEVTVDLTPRLVAYFEVTILDQRSRNNNERNVSQQQQQQPPHHNAALRPHRGYLPRPRRRNVPFGGHRVFHQHAILAPPLDAQDRLARQGQIAVAPMRHECVAIGLSTLSFNPRSKMPGWCEHSFGYHGDDGGIFHGHGDMLRRYGPSFGPGDIVGCGLDYSTLKIFFVKNGEFLGWAFEKIEKEMVERGLYPTVGVDTECPIHVNFGEVPFKFDLKGFGREKLYW